MKRLLRFAVLAVALALASPQSHAQSKLDSLLAKGDTTAIIDSLMIGFDQYLDSLTKPKSFFAITMGIGNRTFSVSNNSLNTQATDNRLSFTPSAGYYHKSGLGLTATAFISSYQNKLDVFQYAVTPSYDVINDKISTGISYTRYFEKDTAIMNVSPYENDVYAYFNVHRKTWRFGVAAGLANGKFNDILSYRDSALRFNPLTQRLELFYFNVNEQSTNTITDFSLSLSTRKQFSWDALFSRKDRLTLAFTGYLVSGSTRISTKTNRQVSIRKITLSRLNKSYESADGNAFQLQSVALSSSLFYSIGRFSMQPTFFMDYYFPQTEKHFNQVFSVALGVNF